MVTNSANGMRLFSSYLVIFALCLSKASESLLLPSVRIYIYQQVCKGEPGISEALCNAHLRTNNNSNGSNSQQGMTNQQESVVQRRAAEYLLAHRILVNLPAVFFSLFAGSWSDRIGRKYPMMLPPLGGIFAVAFYATGTMVKDGTSLMWLLIGAGVYGLLGKSTVMTVACSSYVADTSTLEERTMLLGRLLAMSFFGVFFGSVLTSLFQSFGSVHWMVLVILAINIALTLVIGLCIRESVQNIESPSCLQMVCPCVNISTGRLAVRDSVGFLMRRRPAQMVLLLLFASLCINQICKQGEHDMILLLSKHAPFNWPGEYYAFYLSLYYACIGLNLLCILPLLMRRANISDAALVVLGLSVKIIRLVVISLANSSWLLFYSAALGSLAGFIVSGIKSMTSKLVDDDEIGQTFSLLSCAEALANILGPTLFSPIYAATVDFFPGTIFCIDAGVQIVMLCLFMKIYIDGSDAKATTMDQNKNDENNKSGDQVASAAVSANENDVSKEEEAN